MINHSGIGTYIKNMIPNLADKYNLALLGNSNILKSFSWSNQVTIISADYPIYSLSEQINLPRHIPDSSLFFSPHYNIPLRNIPAARRLVIIHDVNHLVKINKISFIKESYAKYMINTAIKKSDTVITDSYFSQKEIIRHISQNGKKIKVIYCGINSDEIKFIANQINHEEFRLKYNLPQSYFLYVGSIKAHKNLISALKAFKILIKKYPTQKLVVIGVKQDEFFNHPVINDLREGVIVPGYISDYELPAVYTNALCLVFPSLYEGFGLPPLEAMSCGCPVIASNLSSIPEVCGDAALYFDPLNIEEIFKTMQKIIEDENIVFQLRENGFENLNRFTWQIFSQNIKQEIDKLIIK
jgi:glycosyltransferase involved in cell wall biosynthesis